MKARSVVTAAVHPDTATAPEPSSSERQEIVEAPQLESLTPLAAYSDDFPDDDMFKYPSPTRMYDDVRALNYLHLGANQGETEGRLQLSIQTQFDERRDSIEWIDPLSGARSKVASPDRSYQSLHGLVEGYQLRDPKDNKAFYKEPGDQQRRRSGCASAVAGGEQEDINQIPGAEFRAQRAEKWSYQPPCVDPRRLGGDQ